MAPHPTNQHFALTKRRWFVFAIFFFFMLLHQSDKLLISPLTTDIMKEFNINEAQMGLVTSGAIIVGAFFYPLWGYLYDRFARSQNFWRWHRLSGEQPHGSAQLPEPPAFLVSRASHGY